MHFKKLKKVGVLPQNRSSEIGIDNWVIIIIVIIIIQDVYILHNMFIYYNIKPRLPKQL